MIKLQSLLSKAKFLFLLPMRKMSCIISSGIVRLTQKGGNDHDARPIKLMLLIFMADVTQWMDALRKKKFQTFCVPKEGFDIENKLI